MTAILAAYGFLIGSAVGSFLNVVIYRVPLGRSLVAPGSACPHCGEAIKPWHNVPVVGWLWLLGKCANQACRQPISARYPTIELAMGLIVAALAWHFGPTVDLLIWSAFSALLMVIFWIDIDHQLILDVVTLPGLALGLFYQWSQGQLLHGVLTATFGYGFFRAVREVSTRVFGKQGLGGGDEKFAAMLGAWLGMPAMAVGMFLSFLLGSIVGLGLLIQRGASTKYPFGPSMAVGSVIALVWGRSLVDWYLGWMV
jgi:leader peptidase (prepilin peptidase)/N-methyltransferase